MSYRYEIDPNGQVIEIPEPHIISPTLDKNFKALDEALSEGSWSIALNILRALIIEVHNNLGSTGFVVDLTMSSGYSVSTVDYRFAIPFRWATDALEYAQELVEMGYEPVDAEIFSKLIARVHSEADAYNEWLDNEADRFDGQTY